MPLRQPPPHIQRALTKHFKTVKLQWNPRLGYWVITDDLYVKNQVTYRAAYDPPGGLVGIEKYPRSRRALVWVLGEMRTGERWEPVRDNIMSSLKRAFVGSNRWAKERFMDEFEAKEIALEEKRKAAGNGEKRDRASEWFDRAVRGKGSFSSVCATTAKKVQRDIEQRRAAEAAEEQDSDAAASQLINSGQYIHSGVVGKL